ncbi:lipoyl synthase [bacterium]|nr:lipoyl synthase [bacterium]
MTENHLKRPDWLKVKLPHGENYSQVRSIINEHQLHTVCESAKCPNLGECWGNGTATFMILGDVCTRSCGFCAVITGKPTELDLEEPKKIAKSTQLMKLKHVVITSVNRDELSDGGAEIFARTIYEVRKTNPNTTIEVLIPDFMGNWNALDLVLEAKPEILGHNTETVPRLYKLVRPQARYERTLELLERAKTKNLTAKTGIMLGLGEENSEVVEVMKDLVKIHCDVLTLGQYLQPTKQHLSVKRFVTPEQFKWFRFEGEELGLRHVESGPLVRSSYHAEEQANYSKY